MKTNMPTPTYLKIAVITAFSIIGLLLGYSIFRTHGLSLPSIESGGTVSLAAIFLTGLVTGGLTCMAVQGGLLAATMAQRSTSAKSMGYTKNRLKKSLITGEAALPIVSFLGAKIISYTLLGVLLGLLGSFFTLSLSFQAILQIVVAIFLLGTAANMLNIHPFFRYFIIQPPRFITRIVRKQSKKDTLFAPVMLGGFTVFIPCGTTQAMMALAVASGNPLMGAAILAAFTIGTSPVFFLLGYFTTKLSSSVHTNFMRFAALAIAVLALFNLNNALALAGFQPLEFRSQSPGIAEKNSADIVSISILDTGYTPNSFAIERGSTVTLKISNDGAYGCAAAFAIPYYNYQKIFRVGDVQEITITAPDESMEIPFMCTMGMYRGVIHVL